MDATQTNEEWRPVVDWEGLYEVSDLGRVRSLDRIVLYRDAGFAPRKRQHKSRILTPFSSRAKHCTYPRVDLCANDSRGHQRFKVCALVAAAYHGPRPEGACIRHLNGDPKDSRAVNLAYGTSSENALDTIRHGRHYGVNKTQCVNGHDLSGDNLRINPKGRVCRACCRDRNRRRRAARRDAA